VIARTSERFKDVKKRYNKFTSLCFTLSGSDPWFRTYPRPFTCNYFHFPWLVSLQSYTVRLHAMQRTV